MTYKIVFFDVDGTLVNDKKEVPQSTVAAIKQLKNNGIEPVIATGRAPYFVKDVARHLDIDSYITLNGAYTVYQGQLLKSYPIPKPDLETFVKRALRHGHPVVFQGAQGYFSNVQDHPRMAESIGSLRVEFPGYDPEYWKEHDIFQAFLHCTPEEEALYEGAFPNLRLVRWHPVAMDVLPVGGSKARGILDLLSVVGLRPVDAVAFGDGLNDCEMLSEVGLGIAMGNAVPELKPFADYVTTSVDEDGIANGLRYAELI